MDSRTARSGWSGGVASTAARLTSTASSRSAATPVRSNRFSSRVRRMPARLDRCLARSGWSGGVVATAARLTSTASSRSAATPMRSNRVTNAMPKLASSPARSGWPGGAAATAARLASTASSRSASAPIRSYRFRKASPRIDRMPPRNGWSAGAAAKAARSSLDRLVQISLIAGALVPGQQGAPQVGHLAGVIQVLGRGGGERSPAYLDASSRSASAPVKPYRSRRASAR